MTETTKKHILLCVAGMTPQIITETLYALTQQNGERVDEIRVITTLKGRKRVLEDLLDPHSGKFYEFCRDFGIDPETIKFDESTVTVLRRADGQNFDDLRLGPDNEVAANQICEVVRELAKREETIIHASAAGGRKTMGFYLMAAMQLFGRPEDRLSHVLVSENFEGTDFYYKPPRNRELKKRDGHSVFTDDAQIDLAPIPFIRLRGARSEWLRASASARYVELVRDAQDYLNLADAANEVKIDLRRRRVTVAGSTPKLTVREFFFYSLFALYRQKGSGGDGCATPKEIRRNELDAHLRQMTKARGEEQSVDDYSDSRLKFVADYAKQTESQLTKDEEDYASAVTEIVSKIKGKFENTRLPEYERFIVTNHGGARYGLDVPPDRIIFV